MLLNGKFYNDMLLLNLVTNYVHQCFRLGNMHSRIMASVGPHTRNKGEDDERTRHNICMYSPADESWSFIKQIHSEGRSWFNAAAKFYHSMPSLVWTISHLMLFVCFVVLFLCCFTDNVSICCFYFWMCGIQFYFPCWVIYYNYNLIIC